MGREGLQKPGRRPSQGQLVANGVAHKVVQPVGLAETDFRFRRVHVNVHLFRRHLDKQQHHGKGRGGEDIAIGLAHRMHEQAVAHQAAIDEAVDGVAVELLELGLGGKAGDAQPSRCGRLVVLRPPPRRWFRQPGAGQLDFGCQREKLIQRVLAEDLKNTLCRALDRGRHQQGVGGRVQLKMLVRMSQRVMRNQRGYMSQLGIFRLEEFSPRRGIEKQVTHGERGSHRRPGVLANEQLAAGNFDARSGAFLRRPGQQLHPGDGGDRGQRFSAEAQGGNREQVVRRTELGGGVPFKRQQRIVAHHAAAVIGNANELAAAALDRDHDPGRAGIERILQQLLDHRCRAVDDLAGGDLIGHLVGENADAAHCLFYLYQK